MSSPVVIVVSVPECVTQVYQDDDGRWWRYCFTCDDGSNKYGKHRRGHKTEQDARMSARMHARDATVARHARVWRGKWVKLVVEASSWEAFCDVMEANPVFRRVDWAWQRANPNPVTMGMVQGAYRDRTSNGSDLFAQLVM